MVLPPLLQAASEGKLVDVRRLLSSGARADARDESGWTALHHAVGYGDMPGIHHPMGRAPVREVIDALLKAGAPLNAQDRSGATALMAAISANHEDAARWLAEAGADLRLKDESGGTALTHALWYSRSSKEFVAFLRQKGTPVNLWDALWLGDEPLALRLVAQADPKSIGPRNYSYLHLAAELARTHVVERLLARRASVNARDIEGYTPLHHAIGGFPSEIIPSGQPYWHAHGPVAGREPLLRLLLKAGASRDAASHGYTPLACAILAKRPELMRVLLKAGANPNGKGRFGHLLLFDAIERRNPEVVRTLLDAGASPRARTGNQTALEAARYAGNPQVLALLKKALEKSTKK